MIVLKNFFSKNMQACIDRSGQALRSSGGRGSRIFT